MTLQLVAKRRTLLSEGSTRFSHPTLLHLPASSSRFVGLIALLFGPLVPVAVLKAEVTFCFLSLDIQKNDFHIKTFSHFQVSGWDRC